jgi:hypothetical protein
MKVPDELEVAAKRRQIAHRLAMPLWRWRSVWDGELRKHLRRIADRLDSAVAEDTIRQRLGSLTDFDPKTLDLDLALSLSARLDELLIEHADPGYVCSAVEAEFQRVDTTPMTWKRLYGDRPPEALEAFREGQTVEEPALTSVRNRLKALSRARYEDYALLRTRQSMKSLFLSALALVLLILVPFFGVALVRASSIGSRDVALVGVAGAVGALMSGTFKLRDTITHINDLRAFRPAIVVQPLLGVASALFLLLALETRVLTIGSQTPAWAARGLLGFVAGFSEPFVLKIIDRVANLADRKAEKTGGGGPSAEPPSPEVRES